MHKIQDSKFTLFFNGIVHFYWISILPDKYFLLVWLCWTEFWIFKTLLNVTLAEIWIKQFKVFYYLSSSWQKMYRNFFVRIQDLEGTKARVNIFEEMTNDSVHISLSLCHTMDTVLKTLLASLEWSIFFMFQSPNCLEV